MAIKSFARSGINNFAIYRSAKAGIKFFEVFTLGGGGGGGGSNSDAQLGGGGGSGRFELETLSAGVYVALVGAGGAQGFANPNASGGNRSSFSNLIAAGGSGGAFGQLGGAGGSGGGGGVKGAAGGTNGANGGGPNGGAGSGKTLPSWTPTSAQVAFYGGGSTSAAGNGNGIGAAANTGGGGQAAAIDNIGQFRDGGAGGSGVILIRHPENTSVSLGSGLSGSTAAPSGGFRITTISGGTGYVTLVG